MGSEKNLLELWLAKNHRVRGGDITYRIFVFGK